MHVIGYIQPNEKWVKPAPVYFFKNDFWVYKGKSQFRCPAELLRRMELVELGDGKIRALVKVRCMEGDSNE